MGLFASNTNTDHSGNETFYFHTSNRALIVFTRNPELGKVKSRLAKVTGDEIALKIYRFLLDHTVQVTKDLKVDKYVYYSDKIGTNDCWDENIYRKRLQSGTDLGERMHLAFHDLFSEGYEEVIILGSDMHDLSKDDIDVAFEALQANDYVIGPALDGGYYLLGMQQHIPSVFTQKEWGGDTVLKSTLNDLKSYTVHTLEELNDIDFAEDLKPYPEFSKYIN